MSLLNEKQNTLKDNIERLNLNEFEIGLKIGRCNYGSLAFCRRISSKKIYILKIFKKSYIMQNKLVDHVYGEYLNLLKVYHPFITNFNGINNTDPKNLYFLFEDILGVRLKLHIKLNKKIQLENAKFYLASLITIADYLHKKNIIYRDFKPENILISESGYIKLSDFTFSKELKNDFTYSIVGIPEYYSPEMINQTGHNKSVDFWQFGILLYEMLVGYTPFIDSDPMKLYQKIKKGKIVFPKGFNINAKLIIKHFLNVDMNKRLGCTKRGIFQIVQEPFFRDFDWEGLLHRTLKVPFIPKINRDREFKWKLFEIFNLEDIDTISVPKEKDIFYNW